MSNNQAEYEAILAGLSLAHEVGVKMLTCKTDSKLTVGHLNDEFQIKDLILLQYYHLVRTVIRSAFERVRSNTSQKPTTSKPTSSLN